MKNILCKECQWPDTLSRDDCTLAARFICGDKGNYYFCGAFCEGGKNGNPPLPGWDEAKWQQVIPDDAYPTRR